MLAIWVQWKVVAPYSPPIAVSGTIVVELPVLVTHRRRLRARVVEEHLTRRVLRRAFEIGALVDTVERRLDDAGVASGLDLLLQRVALRTAGDVDQRRQPVE